MVENHRSFHSLLNGGETPLFIFFSVSISFVYPARYSTSTSS
ncbi:hypothetical protein EVA_20779 [gut metagenome]|uniref:Uncharacterized protein n=1 Tax=gut metagenome TaxID=749906 RepID=J9FUU6_9ZZZZ